MAIPRLRRWVVGSSLGVLAIAVVAFKFADVVTDRALTKSAMVETWVRMGMFVDHNKELPASLTLLPRREGYANRVVDAWKRPLIYIVNSQDRFTLTSLGRDGGVGGTGDDPDIIQQYRVIDGNVRREP